MPRRDLTETRRHAVELAPAGARVARPATTHAMTEARIHRRLRQEPIDLGEGLGLGAPIALERGAVRGRTRVDAVPVEQGCAHGGLTCVREGCGGFARHHVRGPRAAGPAGSRRVCRVALDLPAGSGCAPLEAALPAGVPA